MKNEKEEIKILAERERESFLPGRITLWRVRRRRGPFAVNLTGSM